MRAPSTWNPAPPSILSYRNTVSVLSSTTSTGTRRGSTSQVGAGPISGAYTAGMIGRERRPDARLALDPDAAAEQLGELAAERQAQARALHAPLERAVDLGELLEDALLVLGGDPDAGVGDRERDRVLVRAVPRRDAHLAALGELQRVGDEVAQDLRDLRLVGVAAAADPPAPRTPARPTCSTSSGRSMPRSAPNRLPTSNSMGRITIFPASTLARSSRSFTSSASASAALRMKSTCRSCSA